jgi:hypothetical protein
MATEKACTLILTARFKKPAKLRAAITWLRFYALNIALLACLIALFAVLGIVNYLYLIEGKF